MTSPSTPVDIAVSRQAATCTITWSDGWQQVLPLAALRRSCPCAACNEQRAKANPLAVFSGALPTAELATVEAVGGYAVRFGWADGHDTGIYSYDVLRRLGEPPV